MNPGQRKRRGVSRPGPAQSCVFTARLRHYLQSEEIIHADYQGVSPPQSALGVEVTLDKDHGTLSLGTGEGGRISVSRAPDFHSAIQRDTFIPNRLLQNIDKSLIKCCHPIQKVM